VALGGDEVLGASERLGHGDRVLLSESLLEPGKVIGFLFLDVWAEVLSDGFEAGEEVFVVCG